MLEEDSSVIYYYCFLYEIGDTSRGFLYAYELNGICIYKGTIPTAGIGEIDPLGFDVYPLIGVAGFIFDKKRTLWKLCKNVYLSYLCLIGSESHQLMSKLLNSYAHC